MSKRTLSEKSKIQNEQKDTFSIILNFEVRKRKLSKKSFKNLKKPKGHFQKSFSFELSKRTLSKKLLFSIIEKDTFKKSSYFENYKRTLSARSHILK